jgi:branched-chain amino acid transport system substrate-binding protein
MNKTLQIAIGIVIIVVIVVLIVVFTKEKPTEGEVIKIGAILPLTGKAASLGKDMQNAINLAVEKVNKNGEIVEVIYEDEKCDPKEAVIAYKVLKLKGIKLIIGAACSSSTLAIAPLAEQDKIVLITPASGEDKISEAGDYIFRNHVFSSRKGEDLGEFAAIHFNNVATIYDQSNDGTLLFERFLVEKFQEEGKLVLERQGVQGSATDFKTELAKIKIKNPEAILVEALMPQSALIIKQIRELGISSQIITDDAIATDKEFLDAIGDLSEGIIFSGSEFTRETNSKFWDLYTERFGKNPNIFAAQAYDCLMILSDIISQKCRAGDSTCVKNEIYKVKNYDGVSGSATFDENGDAIKPISIKTIKNGQFVPYEE